MRQKTCQIYILDKAQAVIRYQIIIESILYIHILWDVCRSLQWRHNERAGVSNHWRLDGLLNRLFRRRSTKTSKLRVTGLCEGNSPVKANSPHKGLVSRKMFPFDDVIIQSITSSHTWRQCKQYIKCAPVYWLKPHQMSKCDASYQNGTRILFCRRLKDCIHRCLFSVEY